MAHNPIKPERSGISAKSEETSVSGKILSFFIGDDPVVRKMLLAALGLIGVMGGAFGYWYETRPAGDIPVFTPPAGPLKVRPLDRGGLKLPDEDLMDPEATKSKVKLAPAPEAPNTKLLHQMIGQSEEDAKASAAKEEKSVVAKPAAKVEKAAAVAEESEHDFSSLKRPGWRVTIASKTLSVTRAHDIWKRTAAQEGLRLKGVKPLYFYKGKGESNVAIALEGVPTLTEANRLCNTAHGVGQHCDVRFVKKTH